MRKVFMLIAIFMIFRIYRLSYAKAVSFTQENRESRIRVEKRLVRLEKRMSGLEKRFDDIR